MVPALKASTSAATSLNVNTPIPLLFFNVGSWDLPGMRHLWVGYPSMFRPLEAKALGIIFQGKFLSDANFPPSLAI
jgi:hypothetical protein